MKKAKNLVHERLIRLVISLTANCPAQMKKADNLGHERWIRIVISLTANCPAQLKKADNLGHEQWIRLVISLTANCPAQMLGYFAGTCVSRWGGWSVHVVRGCRLVWHIPGDAVAPLFSLSGPSLSGQQYGLWTYKHLFLCRSQPIILIIA